MNLAIVGGIYFERCIEPTWQKLFGSGGRAAASISGRGINVTVSGAIGDREREEAENLAADFGFELRLAISSSSIRFEYVHSLSTPEVFPNPQQLKQDIILEVDADSVLRFGMLEASAKVNARRTVYDPQSAFAPEAFVANGSRTDELVIIANSYEARQITGQNERVAMCEALLNSPGVVAVVLKDGVRGCFVARHGKTIVSIKTYPTRPVFKIGSGDIFSANFSYAWMIDGADPLEAANAASLATAHYVSRQYLPTPIGLKEEDHEGFVLPSIESLGKKGSHKFDVYLAGPFFNLPQRWLIEEAFKHLREMGLRVFSPLHEIGVGPAKIVAPADIEGLADSNLILAFLDGLDPGTIFEIGYGKAIGKPILYYTTNATEESLKMMVGTDCLAFSDFASALYAAGWYSNGP
jgi:nucleoside 2-deoxyribosyltransferase